MWNPKLPSVYQIEVASRCNLRCPFCPTGLANGKADTISKGLIDPTLFRTIVARDLGGSDFIELQHRGEPTLHKDLYSFIYLIKTLGITVGLSTHGGLLHKKPVRDALLLLDYLTISVDAVSPERYKKMRVGGDINALFIGMDHFFMDKLSDKPYVDLQILEIGKDWEKEVTLLRDMAVDKHWDCTVRSMPDTLNGFYDPTLTVTHQRTRDLCLNPWLSVSIHADGDVVPCCLSWGKEVVYGNLNNDSLEHIWHNSATLHMFRQMHLDIHGDLPSPCNRCHAKSPCLFHDKLIKNAMRKHT